MASEHIHRNERGHVLSEKSKAVEYHGEPRPHGDFKLVQPGQSFAHDVGCLCGACMARRRAQAKDPEFIAIVEAQAVKLLPEQAAVLRRAVLGKSGPWWKIW